LGLCPPVSGCQSVQGIFGGVESIAGNQESEIIVNLPSGIKGQLGSIEGGLCSLESGRSLESGNGYPSSASLWTDASRAPSGSPCAAVPVNGGALGEASTAKARSVVAGCEGARGCVGADKHGVFLFLPLL
tara:strand:- start:167 stop:559 length:393 start_codon:yes stop_codon:yes gene_type:complete